MWNQTWLPAASSGGPSVIYPLPSWQSAVESVIGSNARGIPDLAWNAAVNGDVLHDRLRLAGRRAVRGLAGRAAVVISGK